MGEQPLLATTAAVLAMAVYAQDRFEEAGDLCDTSERLAAVEDVATQAMWRGVRAKLRARRGDAEPAEALAREAVRLAEPTDLLVVRGDAWLDLAEVLALDARAGEAEAAAAQGFELYMRKGSVVSATRSRVRPAALARPEPTTHRR
jgi:ATP/maltotriose-dependent transcriptional regulator MalT